MISNLPGTRPKQSTPNDILLEGTRPSCRTALSPRPVADHKVCVQDQQNNSNLLLDKHFASQQLSSSSWFFHVYPAKNAPFPAQLLFECNAGQETGLDIPGDVFRRVDFSTHARSSPHHTPLFRHSVPIRRLGQFVPHPDLKKKSAKHDLD